MTKGPSSTAKRVVATVGATSRAARSGGRAAGGTGWGALSGMRATLGSFGEAGAATPDLSGQVSGVLVFSAGLAARGGSGGAASPAGAAAGGGTSVGAGDVGGARGG